jgi:hypothetical protein
MLQSKFLKLLRQLKNAKSDDCVHKYRTFQGCFFKGTYIFSILLHCKNIKSQSIRRYSKNIVRVGRRKLKRISIIIKNKLIYYQMEQGNKKWETESTKNDWTIYGILMLVYELKKTQNETNCSCENYKW